MRLASTTCHVDPLRTVSRPAHTRRIVLSLGEAHAAVSGLVQERVRVAASAGIDASPQRQVFELLSAMADDARSVVLPREPRDIEDLPMVLVETLGTTKPQFRSRSEVELVAELEEWVQTSLPPLSLPSTTGEERETMPYLEWAALLQSYARYHSGVRWGVGDDGAAERTGSYYRRAYDLRPWHGLYCPEGHAAQIPYVHVLQWMLDGSPGTAAKESNPSWRQHRSSEVFQPPSWAEDGRWSSGRGFTALDVCSQSGYVVDLLLKAGASRVVAVDAQPEALGNTESTVQEHLRERRSTSADGHRHVQVKRCNLLPLASPSKGVITSAAPSSSTPSSVFASAAERRRRTARQQPRYIASASSSREATTSAEYSGPFDVLYYHPPLPSWCPLSALPASPPHASVWWRHVHAVCREPLPWLLCPSSQSSHPHMSLHALQQLVAALLEDCRETTSSPRLAVGGYAVLVLPRSYDPTEVFGEGNTASLADFALTQLDGCYDVVLRRRHRGPGLPLAAMPWVRRLLQVLPWGLSGDDYASFMQDQCWTDVLVLRKRPSAPTTATAVQSDQREEAPTALGGAFPQGVEWEDSFEYCEYKPKAGPGTRYHWTDLVSSHSYLEEDYYDDKQAAVKNFLAVGHTPTLQRTEVPTGPVTSASTAAAAREAAAAYKSLFAEELQGRYRRKMRKLALAPTQQQEYYIDEKLIKSEGAKVEFLNELSRWDLKDYDD